MSADNPKGRGPTIPQDMKEFIRDTHFQHPDYPAKAFITPITEKFGWSPEERAIQKMRKDGTDRLKERNVFDLLQPWDMGTLDKFTIPADAVPYVLNVREFVKSELKHSNFLNVWQVKWIARLYKIKKIKGTFLLWKVATAYAIHELECIFADKKVDTTVLDNLLSAPDVIGAHWNKFIEDIDYRITEYLKNKKIVDAEMWMFYPDLFFGSNTWEELKEKYSKKDGEA